MDNLVLSVSEQTHGRAQALDERLRELGSVAVAFSGGVDSTFLLARAAQVLGDDVLAVTVASPLSPAGELDAAERLAATLGVRHRVLHLDPLSEPGVAANGPDRCYHCKLRIIGAIRELASAEGVAHVAHGEHAGDAGDHRPGSAAAKELGAVAPLAEAGLDKADIRALSREMGLESWDRPSMACLASRIPYGEPLTAGNIAQVGRAEAAVREMVPGALRVRHHGTVARVELSAEKLHLAADPAWRAELVRRVKQAGYAYVALDLEGFRSGSANEIL